MAALDVSMLGLKRTAAAADGRPNKAGKSGAGKGAKKETETGSSEDKLVIQLAKLTLSNSQRISMLASAVVATVVFNKTKQTGETIVNTMKQITVDYGAAAKALPKDEKAAFSAPHTFVWLGLTSLLLELLKDKTDQTSKEWTATLTDHQKDLQQLANAYYGGSEESKKQAALRQAIAHQVKICKLSRCWAAEKHKIEIHAVPNTSAHRAHRVVIEFMIRESDGSEKQGMAPKTDMERRVQSHLDGTR
eukprot:TRINITY_DN27417_c0_g1_i1.p2 TRINITY_DN27417_c0_g1~~TRINITY_DN27417_c0_g1_i1.p2  ORF type:complete len:248 (-),score=66.33 TRINITY_DN27417_c0_g1_i1:325-1068(-)